MKNRLLILLLILLPLNVLAQTDTLFWFAVPYATPLHTTLTADIRLTATDENNITTVTISQPYNPAISPITVTIDPAVSMTQTVSFTQPQLLLFSNNLYNTKTNSAMLIRANHEITAYYELNKSNNNPAIFALKGQNALGYNFWTPFQTQWPNHVFATSNPAFSQIVVVATEDNTTITVNFQKPAAGYPSINTNYTITLNKGQTYMFVPPLIGGVPSVAAADRLVGTHITSNKPISVTLNDDSVQKSGAYDDMGDQSIPVTNIFGKSVIGYEYIIMKGKIGDLGSGNNEKAYVLCTQANTSITVTRRNGAVTTYGPFAAGYQLPIDLLVSNNDYYVHIKATKPVYVLHIAGFGDEMGNAILPTIDGCTGSLSVSFVRSKTQDFYLNLMTKKDAIDSFYISINGGTPTHFLNASYFEQAGTSDWYVLKDANKLRPNSEIPTDRVTRITNTKNVFHLGYFNGVNSNGGCVYGYFSDYNELEAAATVEDQGSIYLVCGVDSIQLKAKGGLSYHWSPTQYLDNPNVQNPILHVPYGGYKQVFACDIEQPCNGTETEYVYVEVPPSPSAFFTVDYDKGCSVFTVNLKDATKGASDYILDLGDGTPLITSKNPINLTHNYSNLTSNIVNYTVTLSAGNVEGCYDSHRDTMTVYPQVISDFEPIDWSDTVICHGTMVSFRNLSSGNTGTYQWYFGDGATSSDATGPSHIYNNFGKNDTVYHAYLHAISPFGCIDTSQIINIRVHPYIYSSFTVDSTIVCSPARFYINPTVSVGVDTFYWSMSDAAKVILNTAFKKTNENPFYFSHTNPRSTPDTIQVSMYAVNRYGCLDISPNRTLIVYPNVVADFSMDKSTICDSSDVLFTNNSSGYNLVYEWNFGDKTSRIETTKTPFSKTYLNRTTHDTTYAVTLKATSDYYCVSTHTDAVTVHPFINANFAMNYSDNCSPLDVTIANTSVGGSAFTWNFGDGNVLSAPFVGTQVHVYENNTLRDTTFIIKMTASNAFGCTDSVTRTVALSARVVSNFSFDTPNQGCNPLTVAFNNNSIGQNLIYNWNFGDNTYSSSQNPPSKVYQNATSKDTTYYVTLHVINLSGCDSSVTQPITVYSKVTADFMIERLDSCSAFKLRVHNYSSGGITDFNWKYTNANSITLHNFSDPDIPVYHNTTLLPISYPFVLNTSNAHGCQAVKSETITIFPEVHASFMPTATAGCQPLPVNFANNTNILGGTSFYWDFGDGTSSNLVTPAEHTYNNLNKTVQLRNVKLQATSQYGCYDDTTITVQVYPYIYAKFMLDRSEICSDELFTIDRSSSAGNINHYYWDFQNDGVVDEDKTDNIFTHTYSNFGSANNNYTIRLTVTNAQGCDTSWTEKIAVHPQVRAAFDIDDNEICYPAVTSFTNHTTPGVTLNYNWDFGDGSSSGDLNPSHAFRNLSHTDDLNFNVSLTATSEYGCDSTITHPITVHPKPLAEFTFPVAIDCPPFTTVFSNASEGTNLSYLWDFDNVVTSTEQNPSHTFYNSTTTVAVKNISLITTTAFGCSDTLERTLSVYPDVETDFTASAWNGCSPFDVNLTGMATNESDYYWYINGMIFSNSENPYYRFENETTSDKVFNVTFKAVSIYGCYEDTTHQIIAYPSPKANFIPVPQSQEFNANTDVTQVTINNLTNNQSTWSYQWSYGDGTTSDNANASFVKDYLVWGDIHDGDKLYIDMIASNKDHSQCSDTANSFIIITPPVPKVELGSNIIGCMPLTVTFPSVTKYVYPDSYQWDFGYKGQISTDIIPEALTYDTAGVYIVRLAVEGDGGVNFDYKLITVYPKPLVGFSYSPDTVWVASQTEAGSPVKFFNFTKEGLNYSWDFGDKSAYNSDYQPTHEYKEAGEYYVTLTAFSTYGCSDTVTKGPIVAEAHGFLKFPDAIIIIPGQPAEEYYDPEKADPSIFRPVSIGVEKYKLEIYNRWGELIYTSHDVKKGWNGFINGSPVQQDVYVWRVTATFTNGKPFVKAGDVTVLVREP